MFYEEFIKYLDDIGACYVVYNNPGRVQVYIHDKDLFLLKKKHPRKYKSLFIPYIRVSGFEEGKIYVRDCGLCFYETEEWVKNKAKELTD